MPMLALGIGLVVFGLLVFVAALVVRGKGKRILSAPVRRTGEAASVQGPASFEGTVRTQQPLVAPCSQQPCVYYELELEKKVKERHGSNTNVRWKTASKQHAGSLFWLDDGSGPLAVHAQDGVDADLTKTFSGPPPAGMPLPPPQGREEVLEYRVTEKLIGADGRLFALGAVTGGQLARPASGKLIVSTRGRDALLGATRRLATVLLVFGGVVVASGATVAIVRPGEARPCAVALKDEQGACVVTSTIVDNPNYDPSKNDFTKKLHLHVFDWTVTKKQKFELHADPMPRDKRELLPWIQVVDKWDLPVNLALDFHMGAAANHFKTKTKTLKPGPYKIYVWSSSAGPDHLVLSIGDVTE